MNLLTHAFFCWLIAVAAFAAGCIAGRIRAEKARAGAELSDPEVRVIERKLFWLSNINSAYNKIQEIFDENKDKFERLELKCENECYRANKFYCRYRSIGNKYVIKMTLGTEDEPFFAIEENRR